MISDKVMNLIAFQIISRPLSLARDIGPGFIVALASAGLPETRPKQAVIFCLTS